MKLCYMILSGGQLKKYFPVFHKKKMLAAEPRPEKEKPLIVKKGASGNSI